MYKKGAGINMRNETFRKGLVCVVMVLFIGMGIMPIAGSLSMEKQTLKSNLGDDTTPPVTTISFDPPYPDGDNGWYVSDVTITLEATDDMSGVDFIKYLLDDSDWLTYTGPFTVESDGYHGITYYAVDKAGNVEQPSEVIRFGIDQTPPIIEITWEVHGNFIQGWEVIFFVTCYDEIGGIDRLEFYLNDVLQFTDDTEPFEWIIEWSSALKSSILKVVAHDSAGNSANATLNLSEINSYSNSQSSQSNLISQSSPQQSSTPLFFQILQRLLTTR